VYQEYYNCSLQLSHEILYPPTKYAVVLDQKRLKLQSLKREEDAAVVMSKLVEDAENLNIQRFKCVLEIKVDILEQ